MMIMIMMIRVDGKPVSPHLFIIDSQRRLSMSGKKECDGESESGELLLLRLADIMTKQPRQQMATRVVVVVISTAVDNVLCCCKTGPMSRCEGGNGRRS